MQGWSAPGVAADCIWSFLKLRSVHRWRIFSSAADYMWPAGVKYAGVCDLGRRPPGAGRRSAGDLQAPEGQTTHGGVVRNSNICVVAAKVSYIRVRVTTKKNVGPCFGPRFLSGVITPRLVGAASCLALAG